MEFAEIIKAREIEKVKFRENFGKEVIDTAITMVNAYNKEILVADLKVSAKIFERVEKTEKGTFYNLKHQKEVKKNC